MIALGTMSLEGRELGGEHGGRHFGVVPVAYAQKRRPSLPSDLFGFARPRGSAVAGWVLRFLYSYLLEGSEGKRKERVSLGYAEEVGPSNGPSMFAPVGSEDGGECAGCLGLAEAERPPTAPSCPLKKRAERGQSGPANCQLAGLRPQTPTAAIGSVRSAPIKTVKTTGNRAGKGYGTNNEQ